MKPFDPEKYFDRRGYTVLLYERQLRELGLIIEKNSVATMLPVVSGGVFELYDLKFKKTSESFSKELVEFLRDNAKFEAAEIERLQQQAVLI